MIVQVNNGEQVTDSPWYRQSSSQWNVPENLSHILEIPRISGHWCWRECSLQNSNALLSHLFHGEMWYQTLSNYRAVFWVLRNYRWIIGRTASIVAFDADVRGNNGWRLQGKWSPRNWSNGWNIGNLLRLCSEYSRPLYITALVIP